MKPLVISVESRKGGVGKTTIALYLAKNLRKKGYITIIADCDITGTSITTATENSEYLRKDLQLIKQDNIDVNLLEFYASQYLTGKQTVDSLFEGISFNSKKTYVIGSEIYSQEGSLIIDPRMLMDELHSYWFITMLQEIAAEIEKVSETNKIAMIIDNSPGYVGIGRSVREWLTSMGPEYARFILVSSLDPQDVSSIIHSAAEIETTMKAKLKIAKYVSSNDGSANLTEEFNDPRNKQFYYKVIDDPRAYQSDVKKEYGMRDYIRIIFNKIPEEQAEQGLSYSFNAVIDKKYIGFVEELVPMTASHFPVDVVSYENFISQQYSSNYVDNNRTGRDGESYDELVKSLNVISERTKANRRCNWVNLSFNLSKMINEIKDRMKECGYKRLSNTVKYEYEPRYWLDELLKITTNAFAYIRSLPEVHDIKSSGHDICSFQKSSLDKYIDEIGINDSKYAKILSDVFSFTFSKAEGNQTSKDSAVQIAILWQMYIAYYRFKMKNNEFRSYLVSVRNKTFSQSYNWVSYFTKDLPIAAKENIPVMNLGRVYGALFDRFQRAVNNSLIRIIDLESDAQILVDALKFVITETKTRTMPSSFTDALTKVIINKKVKYSPTLFDAAKKRAFEVESIDIVLRNVIKAW